MTQLQNRKLELLTSASDEEVWPINCRVYLEKHIPGDEEMCITYSILSYATDTRLSVGLLL